MRAAQCSQQSGKSVIAYCAPTKDLDCLTLFALLFGSRADERKLTRHADPEKGKRL